MCVCVCVCVCIHVLGRIFHMKQNSAWQLVSAQQYDLFLLNIIIVFLIKKFLFWLYWVFIVIRLILVASLVAKRRL